MGEWVSTPCSGDDLEKLGLGCYVRFTLIEVNIGTQGVKCNIWKKEK